MNRPRVWVFLALALCWPVPAAVAQVEVRPVLGGLPADSGLAAGVEFVRYRTVGPLDARLRAVASVKKYEFLEFALEAPPPLTHDFFMEFRARYRNYPEEDFWGTGPSSPKHPRSNYRLEDLSLTSALGFHTRSGLRAALTGGYLKTHIGPGQDRTLAAVDREFGPGYPPDLDTHPDHWLLGATLEYDWRDNRTDPRSGGRSLVRFTRYHDRVGGRSSFNDLALTHQHFIPVRTRHRIAAQVRIRLTGAATGNEPPFYLKPFVGGTDTLRGFPQYRFRDNNAVLFNLEYRHALSGFLDLIGFLDTGSVFPSPSQFTLRDFQNSGGIGARVRFGRRVFAGIDIGASREGGTVWFRSGHTF